MRMEWLSCWKKFSGAFSDVAMDEIVHKTTLGELTNIILR